MIYSDELKAIRERYALAEKAVAAVWLHADDGLYGGLPVEDAPNLLTSAVASARDVPRLADELERLRPAAYVVGLEACKDRECDHIDWETAAGDAECPEVQHLVATLADVKRARRLTELVEALVAAAERVQRDQPADSSGALRPLHELILTGAANTFSRIEQLEQTGEEPSW